MSTVYLHIIESMLQKLSIESSQKRKFQKLQDANQKLKRQIIEQNQKVNEILNATEAIVSENSQLLEEYRKIHQEYDHCSKNLFRLEAMHHNSKRINEDLQTSVKQLTKNREHVSNISYLCRLSQPRSECIHEKCRVQKESRT